MLDNIIDYIVLIAAVCVAITNIYKFFKKPVDVAKEHLDDKQKLHDDELAQTITEQVMDQIEPLMEEIKQINLEQNRQLAQFQLGQLDLLRQQILYLYNHHAEARSLSRDERQFLEDLYRDYSVEGGNGYIKALYEKMQHWDITVD